MGWYNGDMDEVARKGVSIDGAKNVVVIGAGNVALDIARLLIKPPALLRETDIVRAALEQLERSSVEKVTVVARRGPEHAAFATKELRELATLPNVNIELDETLLKSVDAEKVDRPMKRLLKLLEDVAARPRKEGPAKTLRFAFSQTPVALLTKNDVVVGLRTDKEDAIAADMVVASVGYQATTLDEKLAPLAASGTFLSNSQGRIAKGLYVSGWAKRGASGIVGSNKFDAAETVASFLKDNLAPEKPGQLPALPKHALTRAQMERIENAEKLRGKGKFTSVQEIGAFIS